MASTLEIVAVPAFADNYLWLVHDADSGETAVVDPGDPAPVLAEADRRGWRITTDPQHPLAPRPHRRQPGDQGSDRRDDHRPGRREWPDPGPRRRAEGRRPGVARRRIEPKFGKCPAIRWATSPTSFARTGSPSSATPCSPWAAAGCSKARPEQMHDSLGRLAGLPDDIQALLRPRIYAGQRPLRRSRLPAERGDRRAA